jgi:hypothetical protein
MIRILRHHRWRTMHTVLPLQRSKLASLLCSTFPVQRAGLEISGYISRVIEMLRAAGASPGFSEITMPFGSSIKIVSRRPANCSKEFDADHLSGSPNNCATMCGAVRDYQQCKLCRKLDRADDLQRGSSLGLVTNETGNREPPKLNAPYFQSASTPSISQVHYPAFERNVRTPTDIALSTF